MNASDFNQLIRNFPELEATSIEKIEKEIIKAPYCQSLHILLARLKQDQSDPSTEVFIQKAAIYSSNRAHLKSILEQKNSIDKVSSNLPPNTQPIAKEKTLEVVPQVKKIETEETPVFNKDTSSVDLKKSPTGKIFDSIADELIVDLEILKDKTENFSKWTVASESTKATALLEVKSKISETKSTALPVSNTSRATKGLDETDLLLNEIKSSRKKIKPESSRRSEQLEIIDQFIKAKQVTIKPPEKSVQRQDLSENSDSYSENVISETLVEILVRQGKREKAIDVLKKLIWKFPQKKHLFAARIQELSK